MPAWVNLYSLDFFGNSSTEENCFVNTALESPCTYMHTPVSPLTFLSVLILFLFCTVVFAESHHPQEFLKSVRGSNNEGEQIYKHFCINCHAQKPLIALGAPRIGIESDWSSRVKLGIQVLFKHTDEGVNGMPPRGGCFECTDEQLLLTILELVPKKDKKALLNELRDHKKYK